MLTTFDTSHFEMSQLNDDPQRNIPDIVVTLDTSHFEMSTLNDLARRNMPDMSCTLETFQFEMSLLKEVAPENMRLMSVTRDTSHFTIGPCGPSKQSPFGDISRHARTALSSCSLECGENAGGRGQSSRDECKILR